MEVFSFWSNESSILVFLLHKLGKIVLSSFFVLSKFIYMDIKLKEIFQEPCSGLVDYVMIWTKEPFIKNEKSTMFWFLEETKFKSSKCLPNEIEWI